MATITKIRRVANPSGKRRRRFASRMRKKRKSPRIQRNSKGRFVRRAKAKRRPRTTSRRRVRMANPPRRRTRRKNYAAKRRVHRRRSQNPVLIELGAVNPRRRRTSVAKKRYRRAKSRVNPPVVAAAQTRHLGQDVLTGGAVGIRWRLQPPGDGGIIPVVGGMR